MLDCGTLCTIIQQYQTIVMIMQCCSEYCNTQLEHLNCINLTCIPSPKNAVMLL